MDPEAPPRNPFLRRNPKPPPDGSDSPRIRPLDDEPQKPREGSDRLRWVLLLAALASVGVVFFLATTGRDALPRARVEGLSDNERSHLPQLLPIPAGQLNLQGGGAGEPAALPVAPFQISRTEVTVEQFRMFVSHSGYTNAHWADFPCLGSAPDLGWNDPGYEQEDTFPVVCVSAADARAFVQWLSQETGRAMRLPTELEWEYATRGGSRTPFWWGDTYDDRYADCAGCTARLPERPSFVGTRPANAFGLVDVAGNVSEWTCSLFAPIASGEIGKCAAPLDESVNLVVRGGSWQEPVEDLQSRFRRPLGAYHRNVWTGFRVAADASP